MENKSCLICAWRQFCAKKEIIKERYCPDFTLDVTFLKKENNPKLNESEKELSSGHKSTDSK